MVYDNDGPIYSMLSGKVTGYVVSGAGDSNYNGTYCLAGTVRGKNYYQKGDYYIFWYNNWGVNFGGTNVPDPDYFNSTDSASATPPAEGWQARYAPSPAPSLTSTTC